MSIKSGLGRRGFLRGLGAAVALPSLESMRPLLAATTTKGVGLTANGSPLRMAYIYTPNGVNTETWFPRGRGSSYKLSESMAPLEEFRDDMQIVSGFAHENAENGGDGAGDHARSNATFLTGQRAKKTAGSDIKLGISVDQVAARAALDTTRLSSLEMTCDRNRRSGRCDSGYSCAYQFNLSWRSETQPMSPEASPRQVFERLFGSGSTKDRKKSLMQRVNAQKSVLDFISDDAKALHRSLGRNDQLKLDEYLNGVREIERRVSKSEALGLPVDPGVSAPRGKPEDHGEHMRLMSDMMVLAFKTDSTRISSLMFAHDGSNRSFQDIGVSEGHHSLSHHKGKKDNLEKIRKIDEFYIEQFAYFMKAMKETEDVDGNSLLHNSMIVYGSGISDGNSHSHRNLPIIVGGNAGGNFKTGRHLELRGDVPLSNLYVRMLNEFGVEDKRFGDSTGSLKKV